jgi:hypothetical protein
MSEDMEGTRGMAGTLTDRAKKDQKDNCQSGGRRYESVHRKTDVVWRPRSSAPWYVLGG